MSMSVLFGMCILSLRDSQGSGAWLRACVIVRKGTGVVVYYSVRET